MRDGIRSDGPSRSVHARVLNYAAQDFSDCSWEVPEDLFQRSHFERVVRRLQKKSSPGYPYMLRAPTNLVFFKFDAEGNPDKTMMDFVWEILQDRLSTRGPADPIRVFIKAEPHKLKKIEDGRFRLISSVAVVDQIIDHMLFDEMNDLMVDYWPTLPSKVGYAHVKGGWRAIPKETWLATDKTGWDWTVNPWLLEFCLLIRAELCKTHGPLFDLWYSAAKYRYEQLFAHPVLMTSGGLLFRQREPGVQKTGCVNTIADNSLMQYVLHARCQIELGLPPTTIYVMGDDVLQPDFPGLRSYLDLMSQFCILKQEVMSNEFAGFLFKEDNIEPLYKGKHAFNLLHVDPEVLDSLALSYLIIYHRSKDKDFMRALFTEMGVWCFPNCVIDMIVDGDE